MDDLSSRFIGAYNEIHQHLRKLCKAGSDAPFASVLKQAATSSSVVRSYQGELAELNELRNAILHRYQYKEPIATPCLAVVKRLEAIRDTLQSPPSVKSLFQGSVAMCGSGDPIAAVATTMRKGNFSQIPVYKDSTLLALLTTDTLARWFSVCFEDHGGIVDDTPVEAVLQHAEEADNYALIDPCESVFDALEIILSREKQGKRCDAVLITQGRSKIAKPVGIITTSNVPQLYEAIR